MKQTFFRCAFAAAVASGICAPARAGDLKLTMQDGRVTIVADNVPLRQILQEWARIGHTRIVNADRMNGPAVTIQLINATEKDALDILLRSASGYIAAPRPVPLANAAFYDRVTIMATSRPPATNVAAGAPPPAFQRPPAPGEENDEPINVAMPPQGGNPVVGQFPGQFPGQVTGQFPGQFNGMIPPQPGVMPPMMQPGQVPQPVQGSPLMLPRPGAVPTQQVPPGVPNPYQPIRPPGFPGGPGGRGGGPGAI